MLGLDIVVDGDDLVLTPAAAERSPAWSSGQVKRPETFDVRAGAPEPGGLFCPAIFAAEPGRTGHVELAAPVVPGPARPLLAALLGVSEVELMAFGVDELVARVERAEAEGRTLQGWRPRQLVWWSLPVLSPVLRVREPEEVLARDDDGRFATHTLHEPYRRVMIRAARLARLYELKAPAEMVAHEHDGLVEAIDRLLDQSDREAPSEDAFELPVMDAVTLFSAALHPAIVYKLEEEDGDRGWFVRAARIAEKRAYAGRRLAALWQLAGERPRQYLCQEVMYWCTNDPPDRTSALRSRYASALRDAGDDALEVASALAGKIGHEAPGSALHVDALMLWARRSLEDRAGDVALGVAHEAERIARALGDRGRTRAAARLRGAAFLRHGRVQRALTVLAPALRGGSPRYDEGGSFRGVFGDGPRAEALAEAAMVACWAVATTPEWVRALGGLAERASEDDEPAALWARFEAALAEMIATSSDPAEDVEVVRAQARERKLWRTAEAAAKALFAVTSRDAED
ncbi:hypothetical protein [Nannocystis pusilla]|uniref:hypothetical protein n=1 Tax=Nannocystis pusilla TaxID=889268 RepID=UPI003BF00A2B